MVTWLTNSCKIVSYSLRTSARRKRSWMVGALLESRCNLRHQRWPLEGFRGWSQLQQPPSYWPLKGKIDSVEENSDMNDLLDPGLSTSRTMWVIPDLYPMKAVRWTGLDGSSFGKALTLPRCLRLLFLGRNPTCPWRGAENLRWDCGKEMDRLTKCRS